MSIGPGVKHRHGAAPGSVMTHLAITEALDGQTADRQEVVTDTQYGDAKPAPVQAHRVVVRGAADTCAGAAGRRGAQARAADGRRAVRRRMGPSWAVAALPQLGDRQRARRAEPARSDARAPGARHGQRRTKDEISETHHAFYAGWPNAIGAAGVAREVLANGGDHHRTVPDKRSP